MTKLRELQTRTKDFADARIKLAELVEALNAAHEQLLRDNLPGIRRQLNRVADLQSQVQALVANAPEHFIKPRTMVLHGIRIGFEKGKGTILFEDADKVVELIRKKLPELADVLIKKEEKPLKKPLAQLTVQQLKSIGCTVEEVGDNVVVRAIDSNVDKLVTALLKGADVEETAPA